MKRHPKKPKEREYAKLYRKITGNTNEQEELQNKNSTQIPFGKRIRHDRRLSAQKTPARAIAERQVEEKR